LQVERPQAGKCEICIAEKIIFVALEHFSGGCFNHAVFLSYVVTELAKFARSL